MSTSNKKLRSVAFIPHSDDESLYLAYTILREKPLVVIVTDSHIQPNRGEVGCDAQTRWQESVEAMKILGATVIRIGLVDFQLDYHQFGTFLQNSIGEVDEVYCPAIQEGNPHHDIVSRACQAVFGDKCKLYSTYAKGEWFTKGNIEIVPTEEEYELKKKAVACYKSQWNLPSTRPHLEASINAKSEWLVK
jgi:LmbE family N-acetylglucosaminyl deacetylase